MMSLRRGAGILGCIALCLGVVGCSPGVEETLDPFPTVWGTRPSPKPTSSSQWSGDEKAAVDAVHRSIATWSRISQKMDTAEFGGIWEVATGSSAETAEATWIEWSKRGWHLVGDPYFIPTGVSLGPTVDEGQQFYVVGCYIIEEVDVVDREGVSQTGEGRIERGVARFIVLKSHGGKFLEAGSEDQEGTC